MPSWGRILMMTVVCVLVCCGLSLFNVIMGAMGRETGISIVIPLVFGFVLCLGVGIGKLIGDVRPAVLAYFLVFLALGHYGFAAGSGNGAGSYWCFLQPVVAMYMMGFYYGTVYLVVQSALIVVCFCFPIASRMGHYSPEERICIPLAYMVMCIIVFYSQRKLWKRSAEQERLVEEAERANSAKGDFLANMSHEIRTPMNAILGMCEMTLNEEISKEARENTKNALLAGHNLLGIINDILDFSKLDSGKMELTEGVYDTSSLINDVINLVESRKRGDRLEFIVDCDPALPARLIGDEVRIRQILVNLLTNAIKYTREGGVLFSISFRREDYGINLRFSVKDSGIGIKRGNLQKIFHSFAQVDTKKNRAVEGTGLGLPIAKRLAEAMNGFIRVESEYGKGSEFIVVIPQKLVDDEPFISQENLEGVRGLCYWDRKKFDDDFCNQGYKKVIKGLIGRLDAEFDYCDNFAEFTEILSSGKRYTHAVMGRDEYIRSADVLREKGRNLNVIVMQSRYRHMTLPPDVMDVYKPFYVETIVNAINKKTKETVFEGGMKRKRFVAPSAKVLIVDDNAMNLKVTQGLLRPYQLQTEIVGSGLEAVHLVKTNRDYDLIFLDHMMPGMDGVETAAKIRELDGTYFKEVPIVALTANAISGVREKFLESGFQDYLSKPVELNQLEGILSRWLPEEKIEKDRGESGL